VTSVEKRTVNGITVCCIGLLYILSCGLLNVLVLLVKSYINSVKD